MSLGSAPVILLASSGSLSMAALLWPACLQMPARYAALEGMLTGQKAPGCSSPSIAGWPACGPNGAQLQLPQSQNLLDWTDLLPLRSAEAVHIEASMALYTFEQAHGCRWRSPRSRRT